MDYAKIVDADMCELRAARNLADSPNTGRSCLQSLVDLNISAVGQLNSGYFQPESLSIRSAASRHQQVTARQNLLSSILLDGDAHRVPRFSRHSFNPRIQKNVDALVLKQAAQRFTHVFVFSRHQPSVAIDYRHFAAEPTHCLRQLYSHVATAHDQ